MSRMSVLSKGIAVAVGVGALAANSHAVNPRKLPVSDGITVTPTFDVDAAYDDNVYEAGVNEESGWVTTLASGVLFEALRGNGVYQLGYSFNTDFYDISGQDDNTDHHVQGSAQIGLNRSNRLTFTGAYDRVENAANTAVVGENDKLETTRLAAIYGLGTPAGRMNLDLGIDQEIFRSFNSGGINDQREYDKPGASATLYYRLTPKTRALVEYGYDEYDYVLSSSRFDADQNAYSLGLTWSATAQTVGTVKLGRQERDFDDDVLDDTDETSWSADVNWQASPRDSVLLFTSKGIEDGSVEVTENVVDAARYGVEWSHQFTPRVYSRLFYNYADEDYLGTLGREDEVAAYGASIAIDLKRWMTLGFGYSYKDRDSNIAVRDYDRNVYMINLDLSL